MYIAIVEDLQSDSDRLSNLIQTYCKEHHTFCQIETFFNGSGFLEHCENQSYDLVFLDVYMADTCGLTGIDVARILRERNAVSLMVFCSLSREHAADSYMVRAFDYLLKPYSDQRFFEVMNLCSQALRKIDRYIEVKESRTMIRILVQDIIYTDYSNHYIYIHTKNRVVKSYIKFQDFSKALLSYPQFLCCYRNCLINMDKVAVMGSSDFTMKSGEKIPISRNMRMEIRQQYADYEFKKLNGGLV